MLTYFSQKNRKYLIYINNLLECTLFWSEAMNLLKKKILNIIEYWKTSNDCPMPILLVIQENAFYVQYFAANWTR